MSKCWYCNEEITTGNNPEHIGICDKCYDVMFKCGNEFIRNMINKIVDLEAKLAEKDAELKKWSTQYARAYVNRQNCLIAEKVELQKQLEEKEKEIEELKHFKVTIGTVENNQVDISSTTYVEQDKISFAIERLEKVKNEITPIFCVPNGIYSNLHNEVFKTIDSQINELKEMK